MGDVTLFDDAVDALLYSVPGLLFFRRWPSSFGVGVDGDVFGRLF
jgi:hypothetical protein